MKARTDVVIPSAGEESQSSRPGDPSIGKIAIPRLRLRFARAPLGMTTPGDSSPAACGLRSE